MNEDLCYTQCEPDRRTAWQRFICWLLPMKMVALPDKDSLPFECRDVIHVDAVTVFTFSERLKILVFGTVATSIRVLCEQKPGYVHSEIAQYPSEQSRERRLLGAGHD